MATTIATLTATFTTKGVAEGDIGRAATNAKVDVRFGAALIALFLLGLGLPPRLNATVLARMSLPQMAGAADTVVRARCISTQSSWLHGSIWTVTEFAVLENFKGAAHG